MLFVITIIQLEHQDSHYRLQRYCSFPDIFLWPVVTYSCRDRRQKIVYLEIAQKKKKVIFPMSLYKVSWIYFIYFTQSILYFTIYKTDLSFITFHLFIRSVLSWKVHWILLRHSSDDHKRHCSFRVTQDDLWFPQKKQPHIIPPRIRDWQRTWQWVEVACLKL